MPDAHPPALRGWSPSMWPAHLVMVAAVGIATALGFWQLHAWRAHRAAEAVDLTTAPAIALAQAIGPDDPFPGNRVGQPVEVTGTWVPDATLYVQGRTSGAREGYWAVTPVTVDGAHGSALLVVRGWTPAPDQAPPPPAGPARLIGWLEPPEGEVLTDDDPTDNVLPQLRIADAIQHVDQDLYGAFVVTDTPRSLAAMAGTADAAAATGSAGLTPVARHHATGPDWSTGLRNLLYAVQWWVFGAFAAFLWWRHVIDSLAADRALAVRRQQDAAALDPAR